MSLRSFLLIVALVLPPGFAAISAAPEETKVRDDALKYVAKRYEDRLRNEHFTLAPEAREVLLKAIRDAVEKLPVDGTTIESINPNLAGQPARLAEHFKKNGKSRTITVEDMQMALKVLCPLWPIC